MRSLFTVAALGIVAGFAGQAAAQEATPSTTQAPTPEAAARFIDTVIGNGVAKVGQLENANRYVLAETAESATTANCKTVIVFPKGSYSLRTVIELDWRTYVGANSFFAADVTDRWAARLLTRTKTMYANNNDITNVSESSIKSIMGVAVEPGTAELKDRLIRAMEFYGKSCAPKLDGPF